MRFTCDVIPAIVHEVFLLDVLVMSFQLMYLRCTCQILPAHVLEMCLGIFVQQYVLLFHCLVIISSTSTSIMSFGNQGYKLSLKSFQYQGHEASQVHKYIISSTNIKPTKITTLLGLVT